MNSLIGLALCVVVPLCLTCSDAAESDVVRVFDPKSKLTKEEMMDILKSANLEKVGFKKSVESAIETDENGVMKLKKTIHFIATDHCSKVAFWQHMLEQRLPANFFTSNIGRSFVREMQSRIKGRSTKYCKVGLEIHLNRCDSGNKGTNRLKKRNSARPCVFCGSCEWGKIVY